MYVDLRSIGSNGSIYNDSTLSFTQRASTLLIDFLGAIHDQLLEIFVDSTELDLSAAGGHLDRFANAISTTRVEGPVSIKEQRHHEDTASVKAGVALKKLDPTFNIYVGSTNKEADDSEVSYELAREAHVIFGDLNAPLKAIAGLAKGKRFVVLVDEWSDIPLELQPFLADLIRKALIASGMTLKIAAIEHRARFAQVSKSGQYVGLQLGADVMADVNLDDFMVFENDEQRAVNFFRNLIYRHCLSNLDKSVAAQYKDESAFILSIFTEKRALEEFVRAAEGVPRDALNLLNKAAIKAEDRRIGVEDVRAAAREWYQSDKAAFINQDVETKRLLNWIVDKVIRGRKARAFLFDADRREDLIDRLFDSRSLHILKKNISSKEGGQRFDAYKLDYGCYVDLIKTSMNPNALLDDDLAGLPTDEVPDDDYRAIRRAILDFSDFAAAGNSAI